MAGTDHGQTQAKPDGRRRLEPGPDHPIAVHAFPGRVRVVFNGHLVADSVHAIRLQEAGYPPVYYIPRQDCDWARFTPSDHGSYCPYKGDASYFHLDVDGRRAVNAVWSYEAPFAAVSRIGGFVAFYPDRVDRIEAD
jgi:uncharacterized protein (DUF427 family)